jgi:hypothetical protein
MSAIHLRHAVIDLTDFGCISTFADGAVLPSQAHYTPHYYVVSHRTGCGDDVVAYAFRHDFVHHFLAERLLDKPSPALWGAAHGNPVSPGEAAIEESAVMTFQKWLHANERPIIGPGVDWDALKAEALALLEMKNKLTETARSAMLKEYAEPCK